MNSSSRDSTPFLNRKAGNYTNFFLIVSIKRRCALHDGAGRQGEELGQGDEMGLKTKRTGIISGLLVLMFILVANASARD